jgi:hypothetical protein
MINSVSVRAYYGRNKSLVAFRKAMARCRSDGAVPHMYSMRMHEIPIDALLLAFGDWASRTGDSYIIKRQCVKMQKLRRQLNKS